MNYGIVFAQQWQPQLVLILEVDTAAMLAGAGRQETSSIFRSMSVSWGFMEVKSHDTEDNPAKFLVVYYVVFFNNCFVYGL